MGLDLINFTLTIEERFGIYIPDSDAQLIETPGQLVTYLETRVRKGMTEVCLEQRAFYRLRRAGMQVLSRPRDAFKPETPWVDLPRPRQQDHQMIMNIERAEPMRGQVNWKEAKGE